MTSPAQAERDRRPLVVAVVVVVILFVAAWYFALGPGTRILSPEGATVAEFSGNASQTTASFTVRGSWQIRWNSTGGGFAMAIVGDRNFGTIINETEAAEGVSTPTTGGTFHLEITAGGPWTVTILQGE
ncbi:MAG: hypothetical protein L0227_06790 [Chloroflexi bacterium]|nr:hypothetical protein [Chloroflexota bacterium]